MLRRNTADGEKTDRHTRAHVDTFNQSTRRRAPENKTRHTNLRLLTRRVTATKEKTGHHPPRTTRIEKTKQSHKSTDNYQQQQLSPAVTTLLRCERARRAIPHVHMWYKLRWPATNIVGHIFGEILSSISPQTVVTITAATHRTIDS